MRLVVNTLIVKGVMMGFSIEKRRRKHYEKSAMLKIVYWCRSSTKPSKISNYCFTENMKSKPSTDRVLP